MTKQMLRKKIRELEQSLESAKAAEKEALEAKAAADAQGRTDGFFAGRLAGKIEGIIEGREAFLQSDEYKQSLANARLQGTRDFLKSPVFKTAVDVQSATSALSSEAASDPSGEDEFASLMTK
ncbi:hypothetical protein Salat_1667000 [Sesamum alatum]|uniref:Uncharacterized protein n=1 Tax=Sesamum alatum TaxID=300844 RepID=A0AAE1Y6R3_9LAMI|nr:hypothetical protein Salat_1667000 [Sesamum alatum]